MQMPGNSVSVTWLLLDNGKSHAKQWFMLGLNVTHFKLCICSLSATASATGGAGIPEGGLVTMILVLNSVGLPTDSLTLIFSLDWLL